MNISENGISLIKDSEGYSEKAYRCPAGFWTIGYGSTQTPADRYIQEGETCTKEQAVEYLRHDVRAIEGYLNANLPQLNQNQFDALTSLIYNIGIQAFRNSTLLKCIKNSPEDKMSIARYWLQWNKAKKPKTGELVVLPGLTIRRTKELNLYGSAAKQSSSGSTVKTTPVKG